MKTWGLGLLTVAVALALVVPASAQDPGGGESEFVTQGELAQRLVERLGLWRVMGARARPTNAECFGVLLAAGITPSEQGWEEEEPVTVAVLVRVLVLALGEGERVPADQRDNPDAWMEALRALLEDMGIIETVEGALSVLSPNEGIRNIIEWFTLTSDELTRRHISESIILEAMEEIAPVRPRRRIDVTPDENTGLEDR